MIDLTKLTPNERAAFYELAAHIYNANVMIGQLAGQFEHNEYMSLSAFNAKLQAVLSAHVEMIECDACGAYLDRCQCDAKGKR